jgi:hypothetical protein
MTVERGNKPYEDGLTLMRSPVVKRHTKPVSGISSTFLGWRCRCSDTRADGISTRRCRRRVPAPHTYGGALAGDAATAHEPLVARGDRETSRGPRTVLFTEGAERFPLAREGQVRVRGRPRPASSAIVRDRGAGARGQATRRDQGDKAAVLRGVP